MNFGARDLNDEERELMAVADQMFHDNAPMTAAEAATVILTDVSPNAGGFLSVTMPTLSTGQFEQTPKRRTTTR